MGLLIKYVLNWICCFYYSINHFSFLLICWIIGIDCFADLIGCTLRWAVWLSNVNWLILKFNWLFLFSSKNFKILNYCFSSLVDYCFLVHFWLEKFNWLFNGLNWLLFYYCVVVTIISIYYFCFSIDWYSTM